MAHMAKEEDTYMGYRIPKGAVILANIWWGLTCNNVILVNLCVLRQMTHDPDIYNDPLHFRPERFLGENGRDAEPDPRSVAFGFGRRWVSQAFCKCFTTQLMRIQESVQERSSLISAYTSQLQCRWPCSISPSQRTSLVTKLNRSTNMCLVLLRTFFFLQMLVPRIDFLTFI